MKNVATARIAASLRGMVQREWRTIRMMSKNTGLSSPLPIIIVAVLTVALVLFLGNQSFRETERTAVDEFNQRQLALAREATDGIELYFETLARVVRAVGMVPEVQLFSEYHTRWEIGHEFDEIKPLGVNDIGVLDADGTMRYNVASPRTEGADFSTASYYQEAKAMASSDSYIVEFIEFMGVEEGQEGAILAVPMFKPSDGEDPAAPASEFAGLVSCTLKLDTVTEKFIASLSSAEGGHAFLIDDENTVLWAPDSSLFGENLLDKASGFPAFQQIIERMTDGQLGAGEYLYYRFEETAEEYGSDKEEILIAHTPVHLGEELWAVGVWAPKEEARALVRSAYLSQLFVVVLSLLVIVLGCSYALLISYRHNKILEKEVETKTGELKESHARLLTVLDSLDASVYVADMNTYEILFVNKHLRDLLGDVLEKICWQVLHSGQTGPCPFCTNNRLLAADGKPGDVYRWEFQDPVTGRWDHIRDRAIEWVDGRIVRVQIAVDITKRKQAEEALQQAHDELEKRVEERTSDLAKANEELQLEISERKKIEEQQQALLAAREEQNRRIVEAHSELDEALRTVTAQAEELERSNKDLEQFAYIASHDLQEPLRMVASYTQLLADRYQGRLDEKADLFINYAVDGATRMQTLIDDLLTYSRVTTKGKPLKPTECRDAFDQAIANLGMAIQEKDAFITNDDLPTVMADNTQLVQLLQNLIGNAIKFHSEKQPQVHVSATQEDDEWVFSVRDNGIGFEPEYADRIFQMFQRLNKRGERPGTGIGLAVCKKIVERHNGRIWVESEPGRGSEFHFTLQKATAKQEHQDEEEEDE